MRVASCELVESRRRQVSGQWVGWVLATVVVAALGPTRAVAADDVAWAELAAVRERLASA